MWPEVEGKTLWDMQSWNVIYFNGNYCSKESACNAGDLGSIPGLGRSPGEWKGYPLQYSWLENSMDCIVHGVTKSRTWLNNFHLHLHFQSRMSSRGSGYCGIFQCFSKHNPQTPYMLVIEISVFHSKSTEPGGSDSMILQKNSQNSQ